MVFRNKTRFEYLEVSNELYRAISLTEIQEFQPE